MKFKIYIIVLLVLLGSICSCNQSSSFEEKSKTNCDNGIQKAIVDATNGEYEFLSYSLPKSADYDDNFQSFYKEFILEKYGIEIGDWTLICGITSYSGSYDVECYSKKMKELVFEKYGKDIFSKVESEALSHYESHIQRKIDDGYVFSQIEIDTLPEFIGGRNALENYLKNNLRGIKTTKNRVYVRFTVERNGLISDVETGEVHKTIHNKLINVMKKMPKWKPGIYIGKPVSVKMVIPIEVRETK